MSKSINLIFAIKINLKFLRMNNLKLLFVTFLLINTSLIAQFNWDNADWSGLSFGDLGGSVNFHIADINQYPSMQCSVTQNQQITYNCYTQSNLCGNSSRCIYIIR